MIVVLDQLTKWIIAKTFPLHESISLIPNVVYLTYIQNTGAGFGILKNMNALLIWMIIFVIGLILYNYQKIPKKPFPQIMTACVVGGAIGNLLSRIFLGYVIDFIDFRFWPAFNLADSAVTIGIIGLIIYFWKK